MHVCNVYGRMAKSVLPFIMALHTINRPIFLLSVDENAAPSPAAFDGSTSIAPTLIPDGAVYYKGFEQGNFPQDYPEWTTSNDGNVDLVWEPTTEEASSGVYSIRSPVLYNEEGTPSSAKATLAYPERLVEILGPRDKLRLHHLQW